MGRVDCVMITQLLRNNCVNTIDDIVNTVDVFVLWDETVGKTVTKRTGGMQRWG